MLPSLVDVFEEDPVVEAAALGALTARFRHNVLPAHVMSRGESLEYFQNVGQFRCQLPVRLLHPAAWTPNGKPAGLSASSKRSATPSGARQPPAQLRTMHVSASAVGWQARSPGGQARAWLAAQGECWPGE